MSGPLIAVLFPGQGAQFVGMGQALAHELPAARELYNTASQVLGYDLLALCSEGPADKLNETIHSQPALFVSSMAAVLKFQLDHPAQAAQVSAAAGLSLGEYSALVFAGAMSFEDGLRAVHERASAMQAAADASPGGMASVLGLEADVLERLCNNVREPGEILQIANFLCPGNLVVSGHRTAVDRLAPAALAAGAMKVIPLAVAGAFHTQLMEPAAERLRAVLAATPLHQPKIPVLSNVDARPHQGPTEIREHLVRQLVNPVRWHEDMQYLLTHQHQSFFELGAGKVLKGLLKRIDRNASCETIG